MAERLKDKEDLKLESMFRSDPVADDGFSVKVVSRVRRRIWIRRLSMPVAIGVGLIVSAKPMLQIAGIVPELANSLFGFSLSIDQLPVADIPGDIPQLSTMLFGATLLMAVMLASKLLEE